MAIQMRRGAKKDFDPEKMLPAEMAITTDGTRKVYAAFAPGDYKELVSKEEVQQIVDEFNKTVDQKIEEPVQQVTEMKKAIDTAIATSNTASNKANAAAGLANAAAKACEGALTGLNTMVDIVTQKACVLGIENGLLTIREA